MRRFHMRHTGLVLLAALLVSSTAARLEEEKVIGLLGEEEEVRGLLGELLASQPAIRVKRDGDRGVT